MLRDNTVAEVLDCIQHKRQLAWYRALLQPKKDFPFRAKLHLQLWKIAG